MEKESTLNKNVIIIGAGGHAKVIADIICENKEDNLIGFLDDDIELQGKNIYLDKKVIGTTKDIEKYKDNYFIIGIGNNETRKKIAEKYNLKWYRTAHPKAIFSKDIEIGEGTIIMPGAIINPGAKIGKHCIINTGAIIEHDNKIEDFVHISPNATLCGTVKVGELTHIGAGAIVKNNIEITTIKKMK